MDFSPSVYTNEHGVLYPYTGAASLRYKPPLPLASHNPHPKTGATQHSTPLQPPIHLCLYTGCVCGGRIPASRLFSEGSTLSTTKLQGPL